jgi:subtilisin family serine protease
MFDSGFSWREALLPTSRQKELPMKTSKMLLMLSLTASPAYAGDSAGAASTEPLAATQEGPERFLRSQRPIKGQYIVVLKAPQPGLMAQQVSMVADQLLARFPGAQRFATYEHSLRGFAARMTEEQARALASLPEVAYVEEDGEVTTAETQWNLPSWGLDRIDERDRPLEGAYSYSPSGWGVNVYVIDTGIRTSHWEFGGRAIGAFTSIFDGWGAQDCNGHGTHVAGTVGGYTYGVAKNVWLYAVRVLNCSGSGTTSGVISGVDWVTANYNWPAVANMSLGGGASTAMDQAVNNSAAAGVFYAVAAGNNSANACNYSPARAANAFTVGATTSGDVRASYSNYGGCVNIFAPGSSITSAWHGWDGNWNTVSGTSMASPHVAGAAALYLEWYPYSSPWDVAWSLSYYATYGRLSSIGSGSPNRLLYTGPGFLQ